MKDKTTTGYTTVTANKEKNSEIAALRFHGIGVAGDAHDGRRAFGRQGHGCQIMECAVACEVGHEGVGDWYLALGATLADDVQPPAAATLEEVRRLCVGGFACPQCGVVQQPDQPSAAFVVLALARGGLRPGLHRFQLHDDLRAALSDRRRGRRDQETRYFSAK